MVSSDIDRHEDSWQQAVIYYADCLLDLKWLHDVLPHSRRQWWHEQCKEIHDNMMMLDVQWGQAFRAEAEILCNTKHNEWEQELRRSMETDVVEDQAQYHARFRPTPVRFTIQLKRSQSEPTIPRGMSGSSAQQYFGFKGNVWNSVWSSCRSYPARMFTNLS